MVKKLAFTLLTFMACSHTLPAQERMAHYPVAQTGITVYMPVNPGAFEFNYSADSAKIYRGVAETADSIAWGVVVAELKDTLPGAFKPETLKGFMNYLQQVFGITGSAGYGEGHTLDNYPNAVGIIDFWGDEAGYDWSVKGWADGRYLCVLFVAARDEIEKNYTKTQLFFNGVRFPK